MAARGSETMDSPVELSWVGNLGRIIGAGAEYARGVPEPAYFVKTLVSHHAMVLTAEAYVAGITDHPSVDLTPICVEVASDLGTEDGSLCVQRLGGDHRRVNNNIRAQWDVAPLVSRALPGRYHYQFRFSLDNGATWRAVPSDVRHLVVTEDLKDVPVEALIESSVLFKVGEVTPARIGWLGPATVRSRRDQLPQPLPAEVELIGKAGAGGEDLFLELALQVWVPGVSNRADLTPEEHTLVLKQLGLRIDSPFFMGSGTETLGFAGKAGIHEHDDIARFNLVQYLESLKSDGVPPPRTGDYLFEVHAGEKHLGALTLHWKCK